MPIEVVVTGDAKELSRDLRRIKQAVPRITARAINELATWARAETIGDVSEKLNLPRVVVSKTRRGGEKTDRFKLYRASTQIPIAKLRVLSAGIQVTDVAGAWTGRKPGQGGGVKAKGGRFYKGAFKAPVHGRTLVFKRTPGSKRLPVFLPRIGTRKAMLETFESRVSGAPGARVFRERFRRLAAFELAKAGLA